MTDEIYTTDDDATTPANNTIVYKVRDPAGDRRTIIKWAKRLIKRVEGMNYFEAQQLQMAISKHEKKKEDQKERRKQRRQEKREATTNARQAR